MTVSNQQAPAYWVVVPAAGVGARMGADCPKQYLPLLQKTVIEHTLSRLLAIKGLAGVYVALGSQDAHWKQLPIAVHPAIYPVEGAAERAGSVLNALIALSDVAQEDDWVLVHDAARPCITQQDIESLIRCVADHPVGGILGVPVSDTLKNVSDGHILSTIDRSALWQAQTPQMFRVGLLRACLQRALAEKKIITDEASALEAFGYKPLMVKGRSSNIKITYPDDLAIAGFLLQQNT
ncbi:2-C-methyl-D-erythritol 4-phosphate cytidylyltransferase [Cellvibrio mixtus]|uniref:2-C-methyl-D-erythritol 4-phosphate cytidylyltransferase n=1 Tax=Cellvibrio mixtus TaxID=39650 RepID=A0A266Q7H3_9GAMM|nr:2-C-methyl-D-erythritol 4-phosphate cytidylyltransferase [Cellvibrio mixtus]OZY85837.1 2-C-methyl-D-erythritol 4-phosphate cytidylyltransferase [Cellvibrio mixtus]